MSIEWKQCPEWEGLYEVSSDGQVRSVDRVVVDANGRSMRYSGRVLKQCASLGGYLQVMFARVGKNFNISVHRTVLTAFIGPCPVGMVACHLDGNQKNNSLSNLEWNTQANNLLDKVTHGTDDRGSKNAMAILTESQVVAIRGALLFPYRGIGRQLARDYGVSPSLISAINVNKKWNWMPGAA